MKIYLKNQQKLLRINQQRITKLLKKALSLLGLQKAELSILFVNDRRIRALNLHYRGIDRTTDVLSFPQVEYLSKYHKCSVTKDCVLGDIVINLHMAKRQAKEHGIRFQEELKILLIHGLVHLIGYDHEKNKYQERKMKRKERSLLNSL